MSAQFGKLDGYVDNVAERFLRKATANFSMAIAVSIVSLCAMAVLVAVILFTGSEFVRQANNNGSPLSYNWAMTVTHLGAMLISVFLVQLALGFSRYQFRLSAHFAACGDLVRLSQGDPDFIAKVAPYFIPTMDFDKMPESPLLSIIQKLADKIPR